MVMFMFITMTIAAVTVNYFHLVEKMSTTRLHPSRMCTTRSSIHHLVVSTCPPGAGTPQRRHTPEQALPLTRSLSTSPLGVGLETPRQIPLNFPLGCGPGNLRCMLG